MRRSPTVSRCLWIGSRRQRQEPIGGRQLASEGFCTPVFGLAGLATGNAAQGQSLVRTDTYELAVGAVQGRFGVRLEVLAAGAGLAGSWPASAVNVRSFSSRRRC